MHRHKETGTSIVILTYNNLKYTKLCINSIRKFTNKDSYEIIIVDNDSTDGTVEWLKKQKDMKIIFNKKNLGFPKGCNQGIEIAKKENDILLLNNDTIVTPNWLKNLKKCLYSKEDIGAVGAVTNSCSNFQTISTDYKNGDEMIEFAKEYNVSDDDKWEERLRLVGYCMLIKRKVVDKIGVLDEIFTPGNFEDDDYSLRIRKAGYKMYLCKDTFIHHFGSVSFGKKAEKYNKLLRINKKKFKEKWGFDPYYIFSFRRELASLIRANIKKLNILHIGCTGGSLLLDIKNKFPNARLYGIEKRKDVVINTGHFGDIKIGNFNKINDFEKDSFNYIIITLQEYNKIDDLISTLSKVRPYIKSDGELIITIPKEFKKQPNKDKLDKVLKEYKLYEGNEDIVLHVKEYSNQNMESFNIKNSINRELIFVLRRIENDIEIDKNINYIKSKITLEEIGVNTLLHIINRDIIKKEKLMTTLSIECYNDGLYNIALELMLEGYKMYPNNEDIAYNLSFMSYNIGEKEAAISILEDFKDKDQQMNELLLTMKEGQ